LRAVLSQNSKTVGFLQQGHWWIKGQELMILLILMRDEV
jgi:hypothetical protein